FSSGRRYTRSKRDWSSDVCSSDLEFSQRLEQKRPVFLRALQQRLCVTVHDSLPIIPLAPLIELPGLGVCFCGIPLGQQIVGKARSEERRVGKSCPSRHSAWLRTSI